MPTFFSLMGEMSARGQIILHPNLTFDRVSMPTAVVDDSIKIFRSKRGNAEQLYTPMRSFSE